MLQISVETFIYMLLHYSSSELNLETDKLDWNIQKRRTEVEIAKRLKEKCKECNVNSRNIDQ